MICLRIYVPLTAVFLLSSQIFGQSLLRDPQLNLDGVYFSPSHVAISGEGSIYVADEATETIQAFDEQGNFRFAIDVPHQGLFWNERLLGIAVDSLGNLHTASRSGQFSIYAPDGTFLETVPVHSELDYASFALGPDDRRFALLGGQVSEIKTDGTLSPIANVEGLFTPFDLHITDDGRFFAFGNRRLSQPGELVGNIASEFSPTGVSLNEFSVDAGNQGGSPVAFAISRSGVHVADNYSGVVRRLSFSGDLLDEAYGVPLTSDLTIGIDGALVAVTRQTRAVERIGPERFEPYSVGRLQFFDRPAYFEYVDRVMELTGINADPTAVETDAHTFIVPGEPGEMVELNFRFIADTDGYSNVLSVYDAAAIESNPFENPRRYQIEALRKSVLHIQEADHREVIRDINFNETAVLETLVVEAGTELGFAHSLLNLFGRLEVHLLQPDSEVSDRLLDRLLTDSLILSQPAANQGRQDNFTFVLGDGTTTILFEDLNLSRGGIVDMVDFVFQIDSRLIPIPEPITALSGGIACALLVLRRRRGYPN